METSDSYAKMFTVSAAFLLVFLVFSVNALPLTASTKTDSAFITFNSPEVGPESNLYKYLRHVNVTQYGWYLSGYNASLTEFNPYTSGPNTNHILWIGKSRPYEMLSGEPIIVAGKVITSVGRISIYTPETGLYAFDQNTGQIMWTYPGLSGGIVIDDQHLLCGTAMINPDTGEFLYTTPTSISIYVPQLKMGFRTSAGSVEGWDFSDPKNAKRLWRSAPTEGTGPLVYANGKVFVGGTYFDPYLKALDAKTGTKLWEIIGFGAGSLAAGEGKIFWTGHTLGICAYDENTGKLLWKWSYRGKTMGSPAVAYGKVYANDYGQGIIAFDANTGGMVWKYIGERTAPFPNGPDEKAYIIQGDTMTPTVVDNKVYFTTLSFQRFATPLPPHWKSEDGTMWNPHDYVVTGNIATCEYVCLDAHHGNLIWKMGVDDIDGKSEKMIGTPGPNLGNAAAADSRVYGVQRSTTNMDGMKVNPYSLLDEKKIINFEWFPPYVYAFGKGPTQFSDIATDKKEYTLGETVTISGKLVDMSSPIDSVSILSTYKRDIAAPASKVPVVLTWSGEGASGQIAVVKTDKDGKFSYTWKPSKTGPLSIIIESAGSDDYEAPDDATTMVAVESSTTFGILGTVTAVVVAVVAFTAVPIYKRKHEGGELP